MRPLRFDIVPLFGGHPRLSLVSLCCRELNKIWSFSVNDAKPEAEDKRYQVVRRSLWQQNGAALRGRRNMAPVVE
jgi:hypothetical protein